MRQALLRFLALSLTVRVASSGNCGAGGVSSSDFNKCYHFFNSPLAFTDAMAVCASVNAHLVTIKSAFELSFINAEARNHLSAEYWIGLDDLDEMDVWKWVDGSDVVYTSWANGYPIIGSPMRCAASVLMSGKWMNRDCYTAKKSLVCEEFDDETEPTTECSDGGVYSAVYGECFYFMNVPEAKADAQRTCLDIGGVLVEVDSEYKQNFVYEEARRRELLGDYWVGLMENGNGFWTWNNSSNVTYNDWDEGYPVESSGMNCAVARSDTGRWCNVLCNSSVHAFVCETSISHNATTNSTTSTTMTTTVISTPTTPTLIPTALTSTRSPAEDGWTYFPPTDSWYKVTYNYGLNFYAREQACVELGGHLASIHSSAENQFIAGFLSTNYYGWIGFISPPAIPYAFAWTDGSQVDYTNWVSKDYPQGNLFCATIFYTGVWVNFDCSAPSGSTPAICKRG